MFALVPVDVPQQATTSAFVRTLAEGGDIPDVPFYSQFKDISSAKWKKIGCGIASLAMVIDYYEPQSVSVDTLLSQGIKAGAYSSAGWTYSGLVKVSQPYGLTGSGYDLKGSGTAFSQFEKFVADGPVIASIHYKFDPKSTIPHLVVVTAIKDGLVYYNDPAAKQGNLTVSVDTFLKAWKQRFIVLRPARKLAHA